MWIDFFEYDDIYSKQNKIYQKKNMYSLNLNLAESEKNRIMSLHNSKKNNHGTSINEQEIITNVAPKKYKLSGITDANFNSFASEFDSNQIKSVNLLTGESLKNILSNPKASGPIIKFIELILKLAAYNFTTAADIKKPAYDKTIADLYSRELSNVSRNFPYDQFMNYYFGGVGKFKEGMEKLITLRLNSIRKS